MATTVCFPRRPRGAPSLDKAAGPDAGVRRGALGILGAVAGVMLATALPRPASAATCPAGVLTPLGLCKTLEATGEVTSTGEPLILQTTRWGYQNSASEACEVREGPDNFFTPGAPFRGQIINFEPGEVSPAFSTQHNAARSNKAWVLQGKEARSAGLPTCAAPSAISCYAVSGPPARLTAQVYDTIDAMYGRGSRQTFVASPALACYSAKVVVDGNTIPSDADRALHLLHHHARAAPRAPDRDRHRRDGHQQAHPPAPAAAVPLADRAGARAEEVAAGLAVGSAKIRAVLRPAAAPLERWDVGRCPASIA
jgi:hypothetical protein